MLTLNTNLPKISNWSLGSKGSSEKGKKLLGVPKALITISESEMVAKAETILEMPYDDSKSKWRSVYNGQSAASLKLCAFRFHYLKER